MKNEITFCGIISMAMIRVKLKRNIITECETEPKCEKKIFGRSLTKLKSNSSSVLYDKQSDKIIPNSNLIKSVNTWKRLAKENNIKAVESKSTYVVYYNIILEIEHI